MTKQQIGTLITSLFAAATLSTAAQAGHHEGKDGDSEHQCQNNNCKGHAECMGFGNSSCGGSNSCKGKGWISAKDEAEWKTKKGLWHKAKAAADTATDKSADKPTDKPAVKNKKAE